MIKAFGVKCLTIWICLNLCSSFGVANQRIRDSRKRTVDNFLNAWLVRKDIPAALRFFHSRSLSNASILEAGCQREDYIPDSEQNNPKAVRLGVSKFLRDGSNHIKGNRLENILFLIGTDNPKQSDYMAGQLRKISFNQPEQDKYYLASLKSVESLLKPNDDWREFGKHYDLRNAFISIFQYRILNEDERYGDDVVILLLWAKEGAEWKIVFVGVPSCSD